MVSQVCRLGCTVTVNIVLMHLRRKKPTELLAEDLERHNSNCESPRELGCGDASMLGAIDRLNLVRAIRKLPLGYKQIFLLHDVMGYEHSEIATSLQCSVGNSKSQLHKARKRMQLLLYGGEGQAEHNLASAACRDAAVTRIGPKRHPEFTHRLSGTAYAASGQRSGCG